MPNKDQTGPKGKGSGTGRGLGRCGKQKESIKFSQNYSNINSVNIGICKRRECKN